MPFNNAIALSERRKEIDRSNLHDKVIVPSRRIKEADQFYQHNRAINHATVSSGRIKEMDRSNLHAAAPSEKMEEIDRCNLHDKCDTCLRQQDVNYCMKECEYQEIPPETIF